MSSSLSIVPFLNKVIDLIINPLLLLMFAVSFLYFVYGVFNFLNQDLNSADKTRGESRSAIMWGIAGMVIMFSVFGIIRFVMGTFGITSSDINSSGATNFLKL
ncbi:MAG: hypothetical protein AB201_02415 [Parcubacteria bacterium C7867-006]|nr:MAG: hypothetical protein AB201_02415 [Parcubacteria bacterium C7867-006]